MSKILIIEDDRAIVNILQMVLEQDGYITDYALNGPAGIDKFKTFDPDVILLDIKMPRMDGLEVLEEIRKLNDKTVVIMISGHGNIQTAVQTTKLGAYDFISKPFDMDRLKLTIQNGLNYRKLISENESMKLVLDSNEVIIGSSNAIKRLKELIAKVAQTSTRVLITGENGTGKELVAKEIHKLSDRRNNSFVHVNCATIPVNMIELELFGAVENYIPGTPRKRAGKFELADKGTIFLDEIGDLSLDAQSKLLNVLSENKIEPLGSLTNKEIDVRVICSTNKNLAELIKAGKFREDLYHRINVFTIEVPPLRECNEDIPELVEHFTSDICKKLGLVHKHFTKSAIEFIKSLKWPGNVRELRNTIERLLIISDKEVIDKDILVNENHEFTSAMDEILNAEISLHKFQDESEKLFIIKKLNEYNWNITKTAEALNIQRSHLYNKIKQYNIENPSKDQRN